MMLGIADWRTPSTSFIGGGASIVPSGNYEQANPHMIPVYPQATSFSGSHDPCVFRLISVGMFAHLKCSTRVSFGGVDGRAFNQEVHGGFLVLGGHLSTSPEERSISSVDSSVPAARITYTDKNGKRTC